jgi:hypothetical protein
MNQPNKTMNGRKMAVVFLVTIFVAAGTAMAIDYPPPDPYQQRAWLTAHLVADVNAQGAFNVEPVANLVSSLNDYQVAALSQYYFLLRSRTEQDAYLYAMQQQGYPNDQIMAANAGLGDILTGMNNQITACYGNLMAMPAPVPYLAQTCYASVPGWCCQAQCYLPDWYYANGYYVGPCLNAAYAGIWGAPLYRAYYDHGSRFYANYHRYGPSTYITNSLRAGRLNADWFRQHNEWRTAPARGRIVTPGRSPRDAQAYAVRRDPTPRQHASVSSQISQRAAPVQDRRVAAPSVARTANQQPVARQRTYAPRASATPAANTHVSRPAAQRPLAAAPRVTSSAPVARAPHAAAAPRASSPAPAARASHAAPAPRAPQSAPVSRGQTRNGDSGQQRHR